MAVEVELKEESLYDFMLVYLKHSRHCECGEKMWVEYNGGHVSDTCLNCPPVFSLDMPGYITAYPLPPEPLPDCIEFKPLEVRYEHYQGYKSHEGFYRMVTPSL